MMSGLRTWREYVRALDEMAEWWASQGLYLWQPSESWFDTLDRLESVTHGPLAALSAESRSVLVGRKRAKDDTAYFGDFGATIQRRLVEKAGDPNFASQVALIDDARRRAGRIGEPLSTAAAADLMAGVVSINGVWLGMGSRLLLSVRPDIFVSVNDGSRNELGKAFSASLPKTAPKSRHCDGYRKLLESVHACRWWREPKPIGVREQAIAQARAALLDVFAFEF